MTQTFPYIPAGTKVMFTSNTDDKVREGVIEGINRRTANEFSAPTSYTVHNSRGQWHVSADEVLPID